MFAKAIDKVAPTEEDIKYIVEHAEGFYNEMFSCPEWMATLKDDDRKRRYVVLVMLSIKKWVDRYLPEDGKDDDAEGKEAVDEDPCCTPCDVVPSKD